MTVRIIIFLLVNLAALGIGGWLMGEGPQGEWYQGVQKAPWTPPGWMFGVAWFTIMICFSIYMGIAWERIEARNILLTAYIIQLLLNIGWNPIFFHFHQTLAGLIIISALTIVVGWILISNRLEMKTWSLLVLPYLVWLLVATSLNAYIWLKN